MAVSAIKEEYLDDVSAQDLLPFVIVGHERDGAKRFLLDDDKNKENRAYFRELENALLEDKSFVIQGCRYTRYKQYYRGLPVKGYQVTAVGQENSDEKDNKKLSNIRCEITDSFSRYSGRLIKGIDLRLPDQYLDRLKRDNHVEVLMDRWLRQSGHIKKHVLNLDHSPLVWVGNEKDAPKVAYEVSFYVTSGTAPAMWPHFIVDAASGETLKYWDNIKKYSSHSHHDRLEVEKGPGGNFKTGKYFFGDVLPGLQVTRNLLSSMCSLSNSNVRVYDLAGNYPSSELNGLQPISYPCLQNEGDDFEVINMSKAYSPANDAYVFGELVLDMLKEWYGVSEFIRGYDNKPEPANMLIHVGESYDNAYWDGYNKIFVFGDGNHEYYPFAFFDIIAHEMGHAVTEFYSELIYEGQSASVDEAFADILAITAKYYLLERYPAGYESIYKNQAINWLIGDQISKKKNGALRSLKFPSHYGGAECVQQAATCRLSYEQLMKSVSKMQDQAMQENVLIYSGSGIIARIFFLLSQLPEVGIKKAFAIFLTSNQVYWTEETDFSMTACGLLRAAKAHKVSVKRIRQIFRQVGLSASC